MRVGLIVYGNLDVVSGGNLYDRRLVEHLRAREHDVELVSFPNGSYVRHLAQNFSFGLKRRLRSSEFDVLVQDELTHPSVYRMNRSLKAALDTPIVSIVHHLRSSEARGERMNDLYRGIEKQYLETIDAFVFNSHTTMQSVEELLQQKTRNVIATPGGDRLGPAISSTRVRARAERGGPRRLLFVGNLIERKGLHLLLEALRDLDEAEWRLDVVGSLEADRSYVRDIRRKIDALASRDRVELHGALDGEQLAEKYRGSDLLVVPSTYEGFGIVYLEAMAFGLPVIAGAAGATDEIVQHEATGFLVPPGDTFSLGLQLRRILEDDELVMQLSLTALERFADHPTWDGSMRSIETFLRELTH